MPQPDTSIIDSQSFAAVDDLSLMVEGLVEGMFSGLHRSPYIGSSSEFSSFRPYMQGDDLRLIDWKVWARSDNFYVRQYQDDTNYVGQILLDASASMNFGKGSENKFAVGRILAACLAYIMVKQKDAPALNLLGPQEFLGLPPKTGRKHLDDILIMLNNAEANGQAQLDDNLMSLIETFTSKGMTLLISDFLFLEQDIEDLLSSIKGQNQEVIAFHLVTPEEDTLSYTGSQFFEDLETQQRVMVDVDTIRSEYLEKFNAFQKRLVQHCHDLGIDYIKVLTDQAIEKSLVTYLEKRDMY